jgi:hypothetical protein
LARAALYWVVRDLEKNANITPATVTRIEAGRSSHASTLEVIRVTFEMPGWNLSPTKTAGWACGLRNRKRKSAENPLR